MLRFLGKFCLSTCYRDSGRADVLSRFKVSHPNVDDHEHDHASGHFRSGSASIGAHDDGGDEDAHARKTSTRIHASERRNTVYASHARRGANDRDRPLKPQTKRLRLRLRHRG